MKAGDMPMKGRLEEHSVSRLLKGILKKDLTGCLTVKRGRITRKLFVKEGMIVFATSTETRDRLGEVFVAQGLLTKKEIQQALKKSRQPAAQLGMILLVEGMITAQDLFQGVSFQVVAILERMRSWRKGDFEFEAACDPPPGAVLLRMPLSLYLGSPTKKAADEEIEEEAEEVSTPAEGVGEADEADMAPEDSPEGDIAAEEAPLLELVGAGEWLEQPASAELEEEPTVGEPEDQVIMDEDGEVEIEMEDALLTPPPPEEEPGPPGEGDVAGPLSEERVFRDESEDPKDQVDKLVAEITFQVQELRRRKGGDASTLLGVPPRCGREKAKEAYDYLAKLLHPDNHPVLLSGDISKEATDLFMEVGAAYREITVFRPGGKKETKGDREPPGRGGRARGSTESMIAGENIRTRFARAKKKMSEGNYWHAVEDLRYIVRLKPKAALYRNLLGFCLMQTGRRLHEAEEHIREAVRLEPGNPDYLTNLGLVYKSGRFFKKARDMFKQALMYDKNHAMARHELRELPRFERRENSSGAFWKKLFG